MALECPHCGKKYRVDPDQMAKLPPAIRCKACKGVIKIPKKADAASESKEEIRVLVCSDCGKQYRVPVAKIPSNRDALPCKACGGTVPLAASEPSSSGDSPADEPDAPENDGSVDREEEGQGERVPIYRNVWFLAGSAAAMLVVLGIGVKAYFFSGDTHLPPPRRPVARDAVPVERDADPVGREESRPVADSSESSTPPQGTEPFLAISANVPLILGTVQQVLQDANQMNMQFAIAAGMIQGMGLETVSLFMTHQGGETFLPSVCARMTNPQMLEQMIIAKMGPAAFLTPVGTGVYAYEMSQLPEEAGESAISLAEYRLHITDGWVIVAPKEMAQALAAEPEKIETYGVARFVETLGSHEDLLSISAHVNPDLYANWEERMQQAWVNNAPPGAPNPVTAEQRATVNRIIAQLEKIERFGVALQISDEGQREIHYRQQFAAGVDGSAIYQAVNQGLLPTGGPGDTLTTVLNQAVLQNPVLNRTVDFQDNQLTVRFDWAKEQDKEVVGAIMMLATTLNFGGGDIGPLAAPGDSGSTP